jgi:hypothetical protein
MERSWLGKEEILNEPALDTIHKESLAEVMTTFKSSVMKTVNANQFLSFRDELHCQLREDFKKMVIGNETKKRSGQSTCGTGGLCVLDSTINSIKSRIVQEFRNKVFTYWTEGELLEEEISCLESTLDNEKQQITMAKVNRTILTNKNPTESFRAAVEEFVFTQNMQILEDNLVRLNNAVNTETEGDINKEVNVMMIQGSSNSNNNNEPNEMMMDKLPGMKKDFVDQIIRNGAEEFKENYDMEMRKVLEQRLNEMHAELKDKQLLDFSRMLQKCGAHDDEDGRLLSIDKDLDSQLRLVVVFR